VSLCGSVVLLPGLVVGLVARASGSRWAWWHYLGTLFVVVLAFSVVRAVGTRSPTTS